MVYSLFNKFWQDALLEPDIDLYIAYYGYPDFFDDISTDTTEVVSVLTEIHKSAHMTIAEIMTAKDMSIDDFAERFCIPRDLCDAWASGTEECPDYVRLMMLRALRLIKVKYDFDHKKYGKKYREQNREAVATTKKRWAENNKEKSREISLRWYHNHKDDPNSNVREKQKEVNQKYYERNRDAILEKRRNATEEEKERAKKYQREYYQRVKKNRITQN